MKGFYEGLMKNSTRNQGAAVGGTTTGASKQSTTQVTGSRSTQDAAGLN